MVQKSQDAIITRMVLLRVFLFVVILVVGFYGVASFESFVRDSLHFKETCSGLFCLNGIETGLMALILSYSFWIGVIFGTLGKKADYIIIGILTILALVSFYGLDLQMYLGLIEVIFAGNLIGFILKILRQKFLVRK